MPREPEPKPALVVDSRRTRCPQPVLDLARRIREVALADVVVVLADDPAAATDLPAWCRMRGQVWLGEWAGTYGSEAVQGYAVRRVV